MYPWPSSPPCWASTLPVIDALITLASEMNRTDYRRDGLTLAAMGLEGVDAATLRAIIQNGFR